MEMVFNLKNINQAAEKLLDQTAGFKVYALHGEMGAGKTTLVHAICEALGVKDNVSSPTFSIINQYTGAQGQPVYHIDLYRLKDENEAVESGVEDCLFSGDMCLVEWPGKAPGIFPLNTLHFFIAAVDEETRRVNYIVSNVRSERGTF